MASFGIVNTTTTSITVTVSELATGYASTRDFFWYMDGALKGQTLGVTPNNTSVSYTYRNLNPGEYYDLRVDIYKGDTDSLLTWFETGGQTQDESFEWDYAGCTASGTPIAGDKKSSNYRVYVSAAEWNRLVDRVNSTKGTSISHVSPGTRISASIVNRVANALGARTVSAGDYITASFFNNLANLA